MSRLTRHQRKQTVYIILGLVVLIILFFSVGIPLLVSGSFFLGKYIGGIKETPSKNTELLGNIDITDLPIATNSSQITISGVAENFDKLQFFIDREKVKEEDIKELGSFTSEIGPLTLGVNEIYLIGVKTKGNQKKESQRYAVIYKTSKPKLEILEPSDNSKTSKDEALLVGKTDEDITLKVNDFPLVVDPNGNFRTSVRLKEGENKVKVEAQDQAGNLEEKILTITFEKE